MNTDHSVKIRSLLLTSVAAAACLSAPGFAFAQSTSTKATTAAAAAAASGKDDSVSEVVVTGSRLRRDTFDAPLPVANVTGEQLRQSGNVILGDALMEQPSIMASNNAQNSSATLFQSGESRVDIRGLGPSRTLVLMDGRRHVNGDPSNPAVDLNMIPSLMIDHV